METDAEWMRRVYGTFQAVSFNHSRRGMGINQGTSEFDQGEATGQGRAGQGRAGQGQTKATMHSSLTSVLARLG